MTRRCDVPYASARGARGDAVRREESERYEDRRGQGVVVSRYLLFFESKLGQYGSRAPHAHHAAVTPPPRSRHQTTDDTRSVRAARRGPGDRTRAEPIKSTHPGPRVHAHTYAHNDTLRRCTVCMNTEAPTPESPIERSAIVSSAADHLYSLEKVTGGLNSAAAALAGSKAGGGAGT